MDLVFRQSEAVAFVDLLGQSIPVAHTTAQFVLVLVVRTEADELPIHLTQGEANFVEFLIGNGNDMETLRVDLAAAHAVVHAGLAMVNLAGQPGIHVEKGAHGIEERGVYRIHQFEKQEMVVVCRPEESMDWYEKMWRWSVELFRSLDIPVRQLECCSGDLADLKVKSCDIEAWSPRQQKYFEVCSCSNLGDAQARRLKMRVKGENGCCNLSDGWCR